MININTYIIEKLKIDKDVNIKPMTEIISNIIEDYCKNVLKFFLP